MREVNRLTTGQGRGCYGDEDEERAEVTFKTGVFVENLLIQLLHPIPYIVYREGVAGLVNRAFLGVTPFFFLQWMSFVCFYASFALFLVYQPRNINVAEMVLMAYAFLTRQMVVATKYAYMSHPELRERRLTHPNPSLNRRQEVITVWGSLAEDIVDEQLHLASVRKKIDLRKYVFEVPQRESEEFQAAGEYEARFNAFNVGKEIIRAADMAQNSRIILVA